MSEVPALQARHSVMVLTHCIQILLEAQFASFVILLYIALVEVDALALLGVPGMQLDMELIYHRVNLVKLAIQLRARSCLLLAPIMQIPFVLVM